MSPRRQFVPAAPCRGGPFTWTGLLLAILVAPLFGLIWAWVADVAQSYFAPMILFPILLGVFAGLSIVGLARFAQIGTPAHDPSGRRAGGRRGRRRAALLRLSGRLLLVPSRRSARARRPDRTCRHWSGEMAPSFGEYMHAPRPDAADRCCAVYVAQGWIAWLTWAIDALLVVAAAVAVTIPAMRVPYCNRCGTWYRTIRSGKIDLPTAQRLAELFGVDEFDHPRSPRYRLSACQGGCGPTRCELSWEEPDGAVRLVQVWLDAARPEPGRRDPRWLESENPEAEI